MSLGYTALLKVECPYLPEGFTAWQDVGGTFYIYNEGTDAVITIPSPYFKA